MIRIPSENGFSTQKRIGLVTMTMSGFMLLLFSEDTNFEGM